MSSNNSLYNVNDYTDVELYTLLDLVNPTDRELEAKILMQIHKYDKIGTKSSQKLSSFFDDIYNHFFETEDEVEGYEDFNDTKRKYQLRNQTEFAIGDNGETGITRMQNDRIEGAADDPNNPENPTKIKAQIQGIETKLETEVMSFEKEKVLNKQIKDLKKQIEGSQEITAVLNQVNAKKKELDQIRAKAEQKHKNVQTKAHSSQEKHENLMASSKEIDALKLKEEEAYKHFFKYKGEFTEVNNQLKDKLQTLNKLTGKANQQNKAKKARKENQQNKELKEKERDVEEKIKKKQKLTTEDLLVFQGKQ